MMIRKIAKRVRRMWRSWIFPRDPFERAIKQWFKQRGDETLRMDYPLRENDLVIDVRGYHGDFAANIHSRYGCRVYLFEPVREYFEHCVDRFSKNDSIKCFDFGLGHEDCTIDISVAGDASSVKREVGGGYVEKVRICRVDTVLSSLRTKEVSLLKVNIEGGEYDLLPFLITSGWMNRIRFLQVQFHNFVPNANGSRRAIRDQLQFTHDEMWNFDFVWESWQLR